MVCDKTVHHPKVVAKTDEYITVQSQNYKRTINLQSWIADGCPDNIPMVGHIADVSMVVACDFRSGNVSTKKDHPIGLRTINTLCN